MSLQSSIPASHHRTPARHLFHFLNNLASIFLKFPQVLLSNASSGCPSPPLRPPSCPQGSPAPYRLHLPVKLCPRPTNPLFEKRKGRLHGSAVFNAHPELLRRSCFRWRPLWSVVLQTGTAAFSERFHLSESFGCAKCALELRFGSNKGRAVGTVYQAGIGCGTREFILGHNSR